MNYIRYEQTASDYKKGELSISKKAVREDFTKTKIVLETFAFIFFK